MAEAGLMVQGVERTLGQDLILRLGSLEKERNFWDSTLWPEISGLFNILREDIHNTDIQGAKHGLQLYDGTPVAALNIFSDGFHGAMISRAITWFAMRLPTKFGFLEDLPEVRQWLQEVQEGLYAEFDNSNFYSEMRPFIKDGVSIGTASMKCEEDKANNRLVFNTMHPNEGFIAQNNLKKIDTYYRKHKLTAREAFQEFNKPEEKAQLSRKLQESFRNNPYNKFDFLHATYPRDDYDDRSLSVTKKRFASVHMEIKAGEELADPNSKPIIRHSGFDQFPVFVWRYFTNPNEVYGRGPAEFALVDAGALQSMAKSNMRAGQMASEPAHNIPVELAGEVHLDPNGMNYIGNDMSRVITPVSSGVNYPIGIDREDRLRESINRHMHVDTFLTMQRATRQMTAEEVRAKLGENAMLLSPAVGDFMQILDQVIDFVFDKAVEAKRIPAVPQILIDAMGGERINTDFLGPLAQAQKRLFERGKIMDGLESLAPLAEVYPEALDLVNPMRTGKELLKAENFPQVGMNTPDEIADLKETRAITAEEENKKIDMQRIAEVLKDLAQGAKNASNAGKDLTEIAALIEQ